MARKPRIHYPGALYHVILRGNAGDHVFSDDVDRTKFCLLVQEGIERFGHRVHAFCLMDTHVHLAVQVGERSLSRIMQNLTFRYTQWYNRRHHRIGHVFHGRYKANVVDVDSYLSALVRYIHLDPWRAGLAARPEDYGWSSHRFYVGRGDVPWLETEFVLKELGEEEGEARREFGRFVAGGMGKEEEEFSPDQSDGRMIGDDGFVERIELGKGGQSRRRLTLDKIIGVVCAVYGMKREQLSAGGQGRQAAEARSMVALVVQEERAITLTEAARVFNRDTSSLTAGASRLRGKLARDEGARQRLAKVESGLTIKRAMGDPDGRSS